MFFDHSIFDGCEHVIFIGRPLWKSLVGSVGTAP